MAIEVKHGARPGSTIYARYGGAEGQAARRALEGFLQASQQQEAQRRKEEFQREMTETGHLQAMERQAFEYDYRLTSQQRADEAKLRQAMYMIEQDETLTPKDRWEARRRIEERQAGIRPLPKRKEIPTDINEMIQYHEGTGSHYYIDRNTGKIQEFGGGLKESELIKTAINLAMNKDTGIVDSKKANKILEEIRKIGRRQPAPAAAGQLEVQEEAPQLEAPKTEVDKKTQGTQVELEKLTVAPPELGQEIRTYGFATTRTDPDKSDNIPVTEANLRAEQIRLEEHRKKRPAEAKPGSNVGGGMGVDKRGSKINRWNTEEKKILETIKKYEDKLGKLMEKRDTLIADLDADEIMRNAALIRQ